MTARLRAFLPLGITIILLSGLIYLIAQQNLRLGANDPQIQISDDIVFSIESGRDPMQMMPPTKTKIDNSLSVFGIIYDDSGNVIASAAELDGKTPELPKGVLDYVRTKGQSRITWQPKPGVREAIVVRKFGGAKPGFVLIGRSLKEVEMRENMLLRQVVAGGLATLVITYAASLIFSENKNKIKKRVTS